jgi:ferredoxin
MRVKVNSELCQGHNRCYALAPDLFDVDDFGYAHARFEDELPVGMEPLARLAEANCPEHAVELLDL